MYRSIVFAGMLSAAFVSAEAQACGAEEKVVVKKGCGGDETTAGNVSYESTCTLSEPADVLFRTASFYNTCDGDKPADKDKDKGEGNIGCLSVTGSKAVCKAGKVNKSEETVFSFWDGIPYGVCDPGSGQSYSASAGG